MLHVACCVLCAVCVACTHPERHWHWTSPDTIRSRPKCEKAVGNSLNKSECYSLIALWMLRMLWILRMLRILYEHCECLVLIARPLRQAKRFCCCGLFGCQSHCRTVPQSHCRTVALSICPTVHMHSCLGLIKLPVCQLNRTAWNSSKSWRILRGICNACNVSLRYRYSYTASATPTAAYINVFLLDRPRRSTALRCVALRYGARLGNCSSLTGPCALEQGKGRRERGREGEREERGGVTAEAQSNGAPHGWLNCSNIVWAVPPRSQYANPQHPPSTDVDPW